MGQPLTEAQLEDRIGQLVRKGFNRGNIRIDPRCTQSGNASGEHYGFKVLGVSLSQTRSFMKGQIICFPVDVTDICSVTFLDIIGRVVRFLVLRKLCMIVWLT